MGLQMRWLRKELGGMCVVTILWRIIRTCLNADKTGIRTHNLMLTGSEFYQYTRFLPGAAAPDSNDGTDVAYTA